MARSIPADSRPLRGPNGIAGLVHVLFSDEALSSPSPAFRAVIALLPLLVFYVVLVVTFARPSFQGDEGGYVKLAMNLARGFYSLSSPVDIWWGPGYPLLLAPFALLRIPWIAPKLANA